MSSFFFNILSQLHHLHPRRDCQPHEHPPEHSEHWGADASQASEAAGELLIVQFGFEVLSFIVC